MALDSGSEALEFYLLAFIRAKINQTDIVLSAFEDRAPAEVFQAARDGAVQGLTRRSQSNLKNLDLNQVKRDQDEVRRSEFSFIHYFDPRYPNLLKEIHAPPFGLFVQGNCEILGLPQIGIVGSRRASRAGYDNAKDFAAELGRAGFAITSGLAEGVDQAAHLGALKTPSPTIAFVGHGLDHHYPAVNRKLRADIVQSGGAVVSEFPFGVPPCAPNFPKRNRLISGVSLGILVVEAAVKSGSLITARLASEQGREVFAIPGSIHSPLSRGCHALIRQGAKLIEKAEDIVEELGGLLSGLAPETPANSREEASLPTDPKHLTLCKHLGQDPQPIERLIRQTGLPSHEVSASLMEMEIAGWASLTAGGYIRTTRSE